MMPRTNPEYPNQRLLDYLTRSDELMIKNIEIQKRILASLERGLPAGSNDASISLSTLVNLKNSLQTGQLFPYGVLSYDMTNAQTEFEVKVEGRNLVAATDGSLDSCFARMNHVQADRTPLKYFDWDMPFFNLYLTWPAQVSKTLYLAIGKQAGAKGSQRNLGSVSSSGAAQILYNALPAASPVYSSMADWRGGKRIVFHITTTLNVACSVQIIGNIADATASATDIDGAIPLAIGSVTTQYATVGPAWDDWHPYIGARITCPPLPAAGLVTIQAVEQE